jgi:RNA polymerase sigma factor (sigma-70 family)
MKAGSSRRDFIRRILFAAAVKSLLSPFSARADSNLVDAKSRRVDRRRLGRLGKEVGVVVGLHLRQSPYERAAEILTNEALRDALEKLSYRERRVLELRYGLGGEHPRTLDEVGRTFNVTRERIRQIENQSLKKLQSLAEAQKLRDVA